MSNKTKNNQNESVNEVIKPYLVSKVDEETGEETLVPKFKYIPGSPRQYRFNGQNGQFNINGERILLDAKGSPITQFSFQPMAWRIFEDNMFGRTRADKWCEIFFVDEKNCVSTIMFNNTTLEELTDLAEKLYYDDVTLADIVLTIKPEKVESKKEGENKSWFVGRFSYDFADKDKTIELQEYAKDYPIYRKDTIKETATYLAKSPTFYLPTKEETETSQAA